MLGRHYASQLLNKTGPSKAAPKPQEVEVSKAKLVLARARRLRANAGVLSSEQFQLKKALFNSKKTGLLRVKSEEGPPPNPLQDPNMMSNMTKQQMTMMVPQMAMMGFVSYFFTGFVLCKVPFPLTNGFREMLQKGVVLQSLDVSYVSSLSVYFLFAFGLSGLFGLMLSGAAPEDMMSAQMGMMDPTAQQQQQPFETGKMFQQERESLDLLHHHSFVGGGKAERRLLEEL